MKKYKIVKNCSSSRLPWEEAEARKGAAAHSLGTTALSCARLRMCVSAHKKTWSAQKCSLPKMFLQISRHSEFG